MKEQILSFLPGDHPWQNQIFWFDTIDSTNTRAKEMAAAGLPHGTVLVAGHQTAGRGRLGRSFQSPAGLGVYMSVILRPNCPPEKLMHLTCAAGVAACDAVLSVSGCRPGIKWINDLVAEKKKLGGILTELGLDPKTGRVSYAVLGIGINCCQLPGDFDESIRNMATSARMVLGREADRERLIAEMVKSLERMELHSPAHMLERYRRDCITLDQSVSILRGDEVRHALALDVDDEGGLVVRYDSGEIGTVTSGEVSVRGLYGYILAK